MSNFETPENQQPDSNRPAESAPAEATPLFVPIKGRPMPDFDRPSRSVYPFDQLEAAQGGTNSFYAGKHSKALMARLYQAISQRKKKHPTERYDYEQMDNGDLYVWRTA